MGAGARWATRALAPCARRGGADRMARPVPGRPEPATGAWSTRAARFATSTAAGDRRLSSAVTTGRRPTASPIARWQHHSRHAPTRAPRSAAAIPGRAADSSPRVRAVNVYAGRDGNVLNARTEPGETRERECGSVNRPTPQTQAAGGAETRDRAGTDRRVTAWRGHPAGRSWDSDNRPRRDARTQRRSARMTTAVRSSASAAESYRGASGAAPRRRSPWRWAAGADRSFPMVIRVGRADGWLFVSKGSIHEKRRLPCSALVAPTARSSAKSEWFDKKVSSRPAWRLGPG